VLSFTMLASCMALAGVLILATRLVGADRPGSGNIPRPLSRFAR
jgi:hypothetical protein